jgi:hypothetical protein
MCRLDREPLLPVSGAVSVTDPIEAARGYQN